MRHAERPEAVIDGLRAHRTAFAWLVGAAVVAHSVGYRDWDVSSLRFWLLVAGVWLMARPSSGARLMIVAALVLVVFAGELPSPFNHDVPAVLLVVLAGWLLIRRIPPDESYHTIVGTGRHLVALGYAAAGFAKLNSGYFDPTVSAGVQLYRNLDDRIRLLPSADGVASLVIAGSVALELGLAVALVLPRSRPYAVLVGIPFHLVLLLDGFLPFSAVMVAAYWLFVPETVASRLADWWRHALARLPAGRPAGAQLLMAGVIAAGFIDTLTALEVARYVRWAVSIAALVGGVALWIFLLRHLRAHDPPTASLGWAGGLVLVVFVMNAALPYLGWKTMYSYTMYSNLQTEGDRWNHFVMPERARLIGTQDELATVHASDDPRIEDLRRDDTQWVAVDIFRYLAETEGTATVTWQDRTYDVVNGLGGPTFGWFDVSLAGFRPVPLPQRNTIQP